MPFEVQIVAPNGADVWFEPALREPVRLGPRQATTLETDVSFVVRSSSPVLVVQRLFSAHATPQDPGESAGDPEWGVILSFDSATSQAPVLIPPLGGHDGSWLIVAMTEDAVVRLDGALIEPSETLPGYRIARVQVEAGVYDLRADSGRFLAWFIGYDNAASWFAPVAYDLRPERLRVRPEQ